MNTTETPPGSSRLIMGTMRLGSWGAQYDTSQYLQLLDHCLEWGIDTIDLADIYGDYTQERDLGQAFKGNSSLREKFYLITKCGICRVCDNRPDYRIKHYDTSRQHIVASVERSLRDLHTDHLDLLLIHRPDMLMDVDEVAEAFQELRKAGKVQGFGVSNFTPRQFEMLNSRFPLLTNQVEIHPMQLDTFLDGTLDQLQQLNLKPQAWSPLGGGALFGKASNEQVVRLQSVLAEIGRKHGAPLDQIILAWLLRHPSGIRPVLGTTQPKRIQSAVQAQQLQLDRQEWYSIWSASTGNPVP